MPTIDRPATRKDQLEAIFLRRYDDLTMGCGSGEQVKRLPLTRHELREYCAECGFVDIQPGHVLTFVGLPVIIVSDAD